MRGRLALLLARVFDRLRAGTDVAMGRPCSNPIVSQMVPDEIWADPATVVDTPQRRHSDRHRAVPVFIAVTIAQPPSRAALSEAMVKRFLGRFAASLEASGRVFSTAEVTTALRREYPSAPMASTRQVARILRELHPPAWANGGRRPVFQVPSAAELAAATEAAKQAAETRP